MIQIQKLQSTSSAIMAQQVFYRGLHSLESTAFAVCCQFYDLQRRRGGRRAYLEFIASFDREEFSRELPPEVSTGRKVST
jgi:hypothetical protein